MPLPSWSIRHPIPGLSGAALLLALAALGGCSPPPAAVEPVRAVRTMTVGARAGATVRDYAADVRARVESPLGFRVPGKIVARPAQLGERVRPGQLLAQLDETDLRLGQDSARAALQAAQINYDQTAADYKRFSALRAQGFISQAELDRRRAGLEAAKSQFEEARAQHAVQANQAGYASLRADAAGVVTAVLADVGSVVGAGTPVVTLAHDGPRDAVFSVPENQVSIFRGLIGRAGGVQVTVWGNSAPVPATVREVAGAADPASRTFQVKASLPEGAAELGQSARVQAQIAPADGLLRLPLQAVAGAGTHSHVWVLDVPTMTVQPREVTIVRPEGDDVVIGSGLHTGDRVVTAGAHVLTPGQRVSFYVEPAAR